MLSILMLLLASGTAALELAPHHLLRCVLRNSQSNEDILLLPLLRSIAAQGGTFVELGAFDGREGSQSWLLEKCFGWKGVLIEASPQNFALLNQTERNPHTRKVHSAVCDADNDKPGEVNVLGGGATVAGVEKDMPSVFKRHWHKAHEDCGGMPCLSKVQCRSLPSIMANAGYPRVNFLSLDVEGGEETVLLTTGKTMDTFQFDVVMVEADRNDRAKNHRVANLLTKMGMKALYIPQSQGSTNELYVRPNIIDVRPNATSLKPLLDAAFALANHTRLMHAIKQHDTSRYLHYIHNRTGGNTVIQRLVAGMHDEVDAFLTDNSEERVAKLAAILQ